MNKTWQFHKSGHNFNIIIKGVNANGIDAEIQIDGDKTVKIDEIQGNLIKFKGYVRVEDTSYLGVRFNDFEGQEGQFAELTSYYDLLKEKQKELHDTEYNAILSGEKSLDYHYEEGEHCSGDVVYGISAEVVRDLHCGRYIDGFGTVIDHKFQNADISVMKRHYEEWRKQQAAIKAERESKIKAFEEEKSKLLEGVNWDIEKHSLRDEGGSTKCYVHINFKPFPHTPLGMWGKGLFLQKNKNYLILLLSPEKFVILNMREHKLMKSAERMDTDASKRTGRDDIHKSKTVS